MTDINKQKFLTELGKLLTFMYEEDRQLALSIYNEVFEQAEDEQAVLSALGSPTRQAVIIARAYNSKERKLQIYSQSRDNEEYYDETPDFVKAIEDAVPFEFVFAPDPVSEDQLSLFEDNLESQSNETAEGNAVSEVEPAEENSQEEEGHPEEAIDEPPHEEETAEATEEETLVEESQEEDLSEEDPHEEAEEDASEAAEEDAAPEADTSEAEAETPAEENTEETGDEENEETEEKPDAEHELSDDEKPEAFIKDFEIKPAPVESAEEEESKAEEALELEDEAEHSGETVSKPRIFLLILYILFAVPITAAGIALLLIPTVLFLALSIAVIAAGSVLLAATFSGFAVFADIMVMLGLALIVLALGLLFLWIFIWFIGGAMASLVRGILDLAHKWCYKEVPAV